MARTTSRRLRAMAISAAIFLAGGAAVTVAVSWGLAAWLPQARWEGEVVVARDKDQTNVLIVRSLRTVGAARHAWARRPPGERAAFGPFMIGTSTEPTTLRFADPSPLRGQQWGQAERVRSNPRGFSTDGCEHATGWPRLSLWYGLAVTPSDAVVAEGGIPLFSSTAPVPFLEAHVFRALPLRIIWPGFAVNTLVYAALLYGAWHLTPAMRRRRRRRKGQCVTCAYDRTGLAPAAPCPECGTPP